MIKATVAIAPHALDCQRWPVRRKEGWGWGIGCGGLWDVYGPAQATPDPATEDGGAAPRQGSRDVAEASTAPLPPRQRAALHAGAGPAVEDGAAEAPGARGPGEPRSDGNVIGPPGSGRASLTDRLHDWLPIAIVVVSVFAAVMGWLASVADEHATRSDELSRQDFVSQQSALLSDTQQVDSDLLLFGNYEQYSLLGQRLLVDANKLGGADRQSLAREGQADIEVARGLGSQMSSLSYSPAMPDDYSIPGAGGNLQRGGTYQQGNPPDAAAALAYELSNDSSLVTLAPNRLHAQAQAERERGVQLVGVAALFIAGLVFFTFAALSQGLRTVWFSTCGLAVALVAIVLFPLAQFG